MSLKEGVSVYLETVGRKNYPAAQMTVACTGGNKTVIAKQRTEHINLIIPGVMLPTMGPEANSENVHVSPERDSITVKNGSWTFVFKEGLIYSPLVMCYEKCSTERETHPCINRPLQKFHLSAIANPPAVSSFSTK